MTYKNGTKQYVLMGVYYGAIMGLCFGLIAQSVLVGVISGLCCGALFAFLMWLFIKPLEKKFDKKRTEIASQRRIICDGAATVQGIGGWLFFTERGLEFYPHKINFSKNEMFVPLNTIAEVKAKKNQIVVFNDKKQSALIVVINGNAWKAQIDAAIKAIQDANVWGSEQA